MKQIILTTTLLIFSHYLGAQKLSDLKPKGGKETKEASSEAVTSSIKVDSGSNQSVMLEAFYNASTKYFYSMASAHLDNFSKPQSMDRTLLVSELHKNESGTIVKFDTKIKSGLTFVARSKGYPTYFQVNNESKTFYFLGDIAVFIERIQSAPNEANNGQITDQSGDVYLFSTNKDLIKNLKLADVQKMITNYLTAAQPKLVEMRKKLKEESMANLNKAPVSFECKNVKMEVTGTKTSEYIGSHDNKKRETYAAIKNDTIYYQVARSLNGQMEMLKSWAVPINIIDGNSTYFMTHFFVNDGEKIFKAMFPIIQFHKYYYWQMLCDGNRFGEFDPEIVSSSEMLEVTFDDDADCKEFFEEVKAIRSKLKTPDPNIGSSHVRLNIKNDSGEKMVIAIEGQGNTTIIPNASYLPRNPIKIGAKVYAVNPTTYKKTDVVLFTVTADMDTKTYLLGSKKIK